MAKTIVPRYHQTILPGSAVFGLALVLFGMTQASPMETFEGLAAIIRAEDVLITDYIAVAGVGPAFVNAGLVTLITVVILKLVNDPLNGATIVTVGLMAGFSLFGKNIANIWPIIIGTGLYALLRRETFAHHVNVALRATALAPVVSFLSAEVNPPAGIITGLIIGFLIPPVAEHAHRVQNGMNLYSLGFTCGLMGMMLVPAFKAFGMEPSSTLVWSGGNNLLLGVALAVLCLFFIGTGLVPKPLEALRAYWSLLRTSGRAPSDYMRTFPAGVVLLNIGVNGLIATGWVLLTGGDLNGATIGGIFTIMGFSAYGKHPFNILPVMAGVLLGSLTNHVEFNAPALQLAALFGTTLAPIAGTFGWPFGILAGIIHSSVVLQAGLPLEGMNLYNNGFSGGLIAIVLYPILTTLVKHRRPVLEEEDLFAMFEQVEPQDPEDLLQNDKD